MENIPQPIQNLTNLFLKIFVFPIIRLIWVGRVDGINNIPKKGGIIIASNHKSYFDFICFNAIAPRGVHYLTAAIFFKKKWWRPIVTLTNQIKVERYGPHRKESARQAFTRVVSMLKQGEAIGIYPEGTRSHDGKLHKAFTGVARMALIARVPVIPVGMIGTYEIMSRYEKRPHLKKCQIKIGKPMSFDQYYGQQSNPKVLENITDQIMLAIARLAGEKYRFSYNQHK